MQTPVPVNTSDHQLDLFGTELALKIDVNAQHPKMTAAAAGILVYISGFWRIIFLPPA